MDSIQKGNMTIGNPLKAILFFSVPIVIGSVFQHLYNVVDTAVIGHVLGDNSLAALGSTSAVYDLIINFANGLTGGFAVILSQMFGAANHERMRRAVSLTYALTLLVAVVMTAVCLVGVTPLLTLLKTPDEIIFEASKYLRIILTYFIITVFYNALAAMLRAVGNSKTPLIALIFSTAINIILDIVFVQFLSFGVAGAAYATVIAQAFSCIYCLIYIRRHCRLLHFRPSELTFDKVMIRNLLSTGFSMSMMLVVVSIGTVTLQSSINSFGAQTITAHNTARKIDSLLALPVGAISTASATFAGQNYGAGKFHRVKTGIFSSICICAAWSIISVALAYTLGGTLVQLLTGTQDPIVIQTAVQYMRINTPFILALGVLVIVRGSLQGIGRKIIPVLASVLELVTKLIGVQFIAPALGYLGVCILEPIIWVAGAVLVAISFVWICRKEERAAAPT